MNDNIFFILFLYSGHLRMAHIWLLSIQVDNLATIIHQHLKVLALHHKLGRILG